MIYILELIFIVLLLAVWWYNNDRKKYSSQPPGMFILRILKSRFSILLTYSTYPSIFFRDTGPTRLPLFGNVLQVMMQSSFPAIAYQKLAEIYGDIMFLKLGQQETGKVFGFLVLVNSCTLESEHYWIFFIQINISTHLKIFHYSCILFTRCHPRGFNA